MTGGRVDGTAPADADTCRMSSDTASTDPAGCSVFLVENDDGVRESLAELLSGEGCRVEVAIHGEEALTRLRARASAGLPEVILLDLVMPVMDGWSFIDALRKDARLASLPVVVLSAVRDPKARTARADAYLSKPLDVGVLRQTLVRMAREGRGPHSSSAFVSTASK